MGTGAMFEWLAAHPDFEMAIGVYRRLRPSSREITAQGS